MASLTGPEVAQVNYKPVIEVSDSKKYDDGVTMKLAGSNGATEFTADELVTIYRYIGDFLTMKGLNTGELGSSLQPGESMTITRY